MRTAVTSAPGSNRDLSLKPGAGDTKQGVSYLSRICNLNRQPKIGIVKRQADGITTKTKADGVRKSSVSF